MKQNYDIVMNAPDPDPRGVQQVWLAQDGRPERQFQVGLKREYIISSFHLMLYMIYNYD